MEMVLDEAFEGELGELEVGKFVSFRYTSEAGSTSGPPVNPRISSVTSSISSHLATQALLFTMPPPLPLLPSHLFRSSLLFFHLSLNNRTYMQ